MGKVVNIYTDGKQHKEDSFFSRKERDQEVKELRKAGWKVKVGSYSNSDIYWYEATR